MDAKSSRISVLLQLIFRRIFYINKNMIKSVLKEDTLRLFLQGRLDTESIVKIEEDILQCCQEQPHQRLVLDASELQYIASSGLRSMLKIAKIEKDFSIVNVSPMVYNVFEMTGFTKIINIKKALRRILLDDCEMIGSGARGAVYRISEDEIVKVNYNPEEEVNLQRELIKAKTAFLLGVATAISFDIVDCGDGRKGVVYETIKSKSLGEIIQQQPERLEELTAKYVAQLKALHSIKTDNAVFDPAKEVLAEQLQNAAQYLSEDEVAKLQRILDAIPEGNSLIHSDAHPKNIMMQGEDMCWIDMEMMGIGHPIYDLFSIAAIIKISSSNEAISLQLSGMNLENLRRFGSCFIRHYFNTEDESEIALYHQHLENMRLVRRVFATGLNTPMAHKSRPMMLESMRSCFFPYIDQMIESVLFLAARCQ